MTETDLPPGPSEPVIDHVPDPVRAVEIEPPRVVETREVRPGGTPLLLTLLLFGAVAGGGYYVWTHPKAAEPPADQQAALAQVQSKLQQLQTQLQTQLRDVADRVDKLEKQTPPPPADTSDLAKRLDDVSGKIDGKIDALAAKEQSDIASVQSALHDTVKPAAAAPGGESSIDAVTQKAQAQIADLGKQVTDGLAQEKQALDQSAAEQKAKLDALTGRLAKIEQGAGNAAGLADRATRVVRLQAAEDALRTGQPLGDIAGAPASLAKYATVAPPTEAQLRAAFPQVAERAAAASRPEVSEKSFFERALARVEDTVTVRRGDHVIVGDPASGILSRAQLDVTNGDLAGAVKVLGELHGPAADAVRDWAGQVRDLFAARAALAELAAHS